jgi:NAD(P)-dependent dehydrogenase (short-subunit alcohol dehydrogenase family)
MHPFGSRALITGGSRGIGLAYAEALAAAGCDLCLIHFQDGEQAAVQCTRLAHETGRRVTHLDADVGESRTARTAVDRAAQSLGGLDIVVSNAGFCHFVPFLDLTDDAWRRHVAVNFDAGFFIGQEAARLMVAQGRGGRIVFTTSVGAFRSNVTQTHYCATKGGLSLLAQGMALELAPHAITVNCIAPGWIHTDINDSRSRDTAIVEPWLRTNCPAGRLGRPDDLKSALLYLCAAESAYVTGSTVTVDGGCNAQL